MPVELTTVRVHYRLSDAALVEQDTRVTLQPAVPVTAPAADLGISTAPVELVLDETTGCLEGRVVRSDDPALSGPLPYRFVVNAPRHFVTSVIEILGDTDLADIAPLPEPVAVNPAYLLVASLGDTVAPLVGGIVPAEHLPTGSGGIAEQIRVTGVAVTALSGHRVVTSAADGTLGYASNTAAGHVHAPLWVTLGAVEAGAVAEVLAYGPLSEPSWAWTPGGPLYLGLDGILTQTPPATPAALFLAQVAVATGATAIFVDRQPSISLA